VSARRGTLPAPPKTGTALRTTLPFRLRAPVEREVALADHGAIVIAGGLDSGGGSTSGVFRVDPATGTLTLVGSVPEAFHDGAGAIIGRALYIFGGGSAQSSSAVQRFSLVTHVSRVVSHLPHALSDIASATTPDGVFLVGGFDGRAPRAEIYRTVDGTHFTRAARLPVGLRYPAVAALGSRVVIAGGVSDHGPSDRVYELDTTTGQLRMIGRLPAPVAHAEAFQLGSRVYVGGGVDGAGNVTGHVFEIDPKTGRIDRVDGSLAVRDAATVVVRGSAVVIGGATAAGATGAVRRLFVR
jgi:outer membrane protein assembly factor BamB